MKVQKIQGACMRDERGSSGRMRQPSSGIILLVSCLLGPAAVSAAAPEVNPQDLQPGLIATYRDQARPAPAEICRLEPSLALAWKAGETAHPRLLPQGETVH